MRGVAGTSLCQPESDGDISFAKFPHTVRRNRRRNSFKYYQSSVILRFHRKIVFFFFFLFVYNAGASASTGDCRFECSTTMFFRCEVRFLIARNSIKLRDIRKNSLVEFFFVGTIGNKN